MPDFDPGGIVPSSRDLLRVLSTRKKSLALACVIDAETPVEDAARLDALGVVLFASAGAGPSMQLAARATKSIPSVCLCPIADPNDCLAARYYGADGVGIDVLGGRWEKLAQTARSVHMLPLALVTDRRGTAAAVEAGARALCIQAPSVETLCAIAGAVAHKLPVLGQLPAPDMAALRSLAGRIDAVIVPRAVHAEAGFADLVAEVDP